MVAGLPRLGLWRAAGSAVASSWGRRYAAPAAHLGYVKDLRERSGAPISDVKAALVDADWDLDEALQVLRKKGLAAVSKKANRHASEGLVGVAKALRCAAVVEVNSETDFVARNDSFRRLVSSCAQAVLDGKSQPVADDGLLDAEEVGATPLPGGVQLKDAVADVASVVRENILLRRAYRLTSTSGVVSAYVHASPAPGLGRLAALVALDASAEPLAPEAAAAAEALGSQIAMHVVAMKPLAVSADQLPRDVLERERDILRAQAAQTGKPSNIVEKMVDGRMKKFYEENCLLHQKFIVDDAKTVKGALDDASKQLNAALKVSKFIRVQCGEGLERDKENLAAEVAGC